MIADRGRAWLRRRPSGPAERDRADTLAAAAPRGCAVTLPAGAHMVPVTTPDALAARIATVLGG